MKKIFALSIAAAIVIIACKKDKTTDPGPTPAPAPETREYEKGEVMKTYANIAFAVYDDSYQKALKLKTAIYNLVNTPSQANMDAAQQAWKDAREPYGQSEAFRFAEGPIDNESDGPEGLINSWPMDESYVDYVKGSPNSGIINKPATYPTIDENTLINANENGGETNIAVGYHAIEFLLWGQDTSANGPGNRKYTDYLLAGGTASNQARRGQYLKTTVDILVSGLKQVRDAWDPAISGNYREEWLAKDHTTAVRTIFTSLNAMADDELSGERMYTAYNDQDQEDEHSCFSDNTHRDLINNAKGISNIYKGTYTRYDLNSTVVSGYSLKDLVTLFESSKNDDVMAALQTSETKIGAIYIPFDQAIILPQERPKVLEAVNALKDEAVKLRAAAASMSITVQ